MTHPALPNLSFTRLSASLALALGGVLPAAQAQLIDGGFDQNPLTSIGNVLNNPFVSIAGIWGQGSSVITNTAGAFGPATGPSMLQMNATGGVSTKAVQAVDLSSFASTINGPGAQYNFSALFNAVRPGAVGGLLLQFFNGSGYSSQFAPFVASNISLDSNPLQWEQKTITGAIPVGSTWMLAQVYYLEASLADAVGSYQPGFVDQAELGITAVPEPGTLAMLLVGGCVIGFKHRRRQPERA